MSLQSIKKARNESTTRHGKHLEHKVMFGAMVEPKFKAIAVLAASINRVSLVQLLMNGVMNEATKAGIVENGILKKEYEETVKNISARLSSELNKKRRIVK